MEEESGKNTAFNINKEYADNYNRWREKEELQKLKDRYGDVSGESGSSSSETEDEDAEGLTPQIEKDWLKTLSAIKSKNPRIYDQKEQFYATDPESNNVSEAESKPKKKSSKPMFLKDYERKVILEKGGVLSEEESDSDTNEKEGKEFITEPGYYEEQEQILKSLKEATGSGSESEEDDLLTKRPQTKKELEKEESDYIEWLKGQKDNLEEEAGQALDPLKSYWNDPGLPEGEKFLRDYILNKRYKEEDEDLPTYDEIVAEEDLSEEEQEWQKQETFEHKYNFRFEDPDPEFIKKYPRLVDDSVRRTDTKRADKRKLAKEKKQKEKEKMKEEIKQLKNLKKKEITDKISKLKEIAGENELDMDVGDLEGDFDPDAHDKLMKKAFSKQYYEQEEDDEKPTWSDDDQLGLNIEEWDTWTGSGNKSDRNDLHEGDEDNDGEDDSDQSDDEEQTEPQPSCSTSVDADLSDRELDARKKTKKKSQFQKIIEAKKPVFDPDEKTFETYLDEYYKLDYEDFVGGQACRFKYRNVVANDFGLSTDEVLSAKEQELNRWVSIKKMSQYRTAEEEELDVRIFGKKGRNDKNKMNVLFSLQEDGEPDQTEEDSGQEKKKKRKRKKKGNLQQDTSVMGSTDNKTYSSKSFTNEPKKMKLFDDDMDGLTEINSKKQKSPEKKKLKTESFSEDKTIKKTKPDIISSQSESDTNTEKKEKKKKKKNEMEISEHSEKVVKTDDISDKQNEKLDSEVSDKNESKNILDSSNVKKKKKKKKNVNVMSEERLKAYGIDPKKFKYTQKKVKVKKSKI